MSVRYLLKRDITRCEEALEKGNLSEIDKLLREFQLSYSMYWQDLHFQGPSGWTEGLSVIELNGFKTRLETLSNLKDEDLTAMMKSKKGLSISNETVVNSNINVSIDVIFEQTIQDIRENGSLSEIERSEILDKIKEIKKIGTEKDTKVNKWEKAKPVFNWLMTKGVDIGLKVIPLIIKALEN